MEVYFDKDFKSILYDKSHHILVGIWKTPVLSNEYRDSMKVMLQAMQQFGCGSLIYDTTHTTVLPEEDIAWTTEHWKPRALEAGMKKMAILAPEDVFTHMAIDEMMQRSADVNSAYFSSMAAAREWITRE